MKRKYVTVVCIKPIIVTLPVGTELKSRRLFVSGVIWIGGVLQCQRAVYITIQSDLRSYYQSTFTCSIDNASKVESCYHL